MLRETIKVKLLAVNAKYPNMENLSIDDWDTCRVIKRKQVDFDAEKGYTDYKIVVRRVSDGKFFKFRYTQFGYGGNDILEQTATEVFEKQKTVKCYK